MGAAGGILAGAESCGVSWSGKADTAAGLGPGQWCPGSSQGACAHTTSPEAPVQSPPTLGCHCYCCPEAVPLQRYSPWEFQGSPPGERQALRGLLPCSHSWLAAAAIAGLASLEDAQTVQSRRSLALTCESGVLQLPSEQTLRQGEKPSPRVAVPRVHEQRGVHCLQCSVTPRFWQHQTPMSCPGLQALMS